jgi:hypothetical protein
LAPDHAPEALQLVAFPDDHVSMDLAPEVMLAGDADMDTDGTGGGGGTGLGTCPPAGSTYRHNPAFQFAETKI